MADYLKSFATQADYDAYIAGSYDKPNVSYIEATDETIFTNYEDGPSTDDTVITGLKIADFTGTTFEDAKTYVKEAFIPEGVTSIAVNAFFPGFTSLENVSLPSTLTTIGNQAFRSTGLTSVNIPSGVSLGTDVFEGCQNLENVDIQSGLTLIPYSTFNGCTALTSIDIPSTVTTIGGSAFQGCTALTSVTVRATTPPTLGSVAFSNTPANMVIYVPAASVEDYKAASGWSNYALKIQAIPTT